jgi:TRAP-type C4-dicarboxylate transport system substrate-binding protein
MLTGHIMNAQFIVVNERVWQNLTQDQRDAISAAAQDTRKRASETIRNQEMGELQKLKDLHMNVIGPDNGLNLDAYKASVSKVMQQTFGAKFRELYEEIDAIR